MESTVSWGEEPHPDNMICQLFFREASGLRRSLNRLLRSQSDVDDVVQETYLRLLQTGRTLEKIGNPKAYFFFVARNIALDSLRRTRLSRRLFAFIEDDEMGNAVENIAANSEDIEYALILKSTIDDVISSLEFLPPNCRRAFILSKINEKTYPEISVEMGVSISMVEKYISQALGHVRSTVPNLFSEHRTPEQVVA